FSLSICSFCVYFIDIYPEFPIVVREFGSVNSPKSFPINACSPIVSTDPKVDNRHLFRFFLLFRKCWHRSSSFNFHTQKAQRMLREICFLPYFFLLEKHIKKALDKSNYTELFLIVI
uniref:hypothetical protein n=3 Tax=Enterococcus faecalis TaxID=1351 RepID=UPI0022E2C56A